MMKITYAAQSVEEFQSLCHWMRDNGFTVSTLAPLPIARPSIPLPAANDSKGPLELEYNRITGRNLRKGRDDQGKDRETLAGERLQAIANGEIATDGGGENPPDQPSPDSFTEDDVF